MKKTTKKAAKAKGESWALAKRPQRAAMPAPRPTPEVVEGDDARLDRIERRQDILRTAVDDLVAVSDLLPGARRRIQATLTRTWD